MTIAHDGRPPLDDEPALQHQSDVDRRLDQIVKSSLKTQAEILSLRARVELLEDRLAEAVSSTSSAAGGAAAVVH